MIRLKIDGLECPIVGNIEFPTFSISRLASCEAWRQGVDINVNIASTPDMDNLFKHFNDLHHSAKFNDSYHKAIFEVDDTEFISGMATLRGYTDNGKSACYEVLIRTGGAEWAESIALTRLNEVPITKTIEMNLSEIESSWQTSSEISFIPLWRDSYPKTAPTGITTPQKSIMPHSYHPFINVRHIINQAISDSGYSIKSDFFQSSLFGKLMMSGAYRQIDTQRAKASMGFYAQRTYSSTAEADTLGRVCVRGPQSLYNCGAIVDTASPTAIDENGAQTHNCYNNGALTFNDNMPTFTPTHDINVAFDIHLEYISDYNIISGTQLQGFDTITPCLGCNVALKLRNPYVDRRNSVKPNTSYKLMIFGDLGNYEFKLGSTSVTIATTDKPVTSIVTPSTAESYVKLFYRPKGGKVYYVYYGEWALYDGHVERSGQCRVSLDIRTPFQHFSASSPKEFNDIFISGAEPGQQLTLCSGCSITPIFSGAPGYGEVVSYRDIANHDISVLDLMNALKHMFNLRFYTHEPSKSLYIEPYDTMDDGKIVDWRSRQADGELRLISRVSECFENTRIGYLPADGATKRIVDDGTTFGQWNYHIDSYAVKQGVKSIINPLFMPTASAIGFSSSASSAKILTIGNRDDVTGDDNVEPRIVVYHGLATLPNNETWESFSGNSNYPLATFHDADSATSLCFEDRDDCNGLNQYYLNELREAEQREILTCDIRLDATEYTSLFDPNSDNATILSRFRLNCNGSSSLFKLYEIGRYNPSTRIARCSFYRTLSD